jgi:hypothetical protein
MSFVLLSAPLRDLKASLSAIMSLRQCELGRGIEDDVDHLSVVRSALPLEFAVESQV